MKRIHNIAMLIILAILVVGLTSAPTIAEAAPEYAKWGKIALEETQKRYNAQIVDYEHIGRSRISDSISEETFKFWIRQKNGKEFGVYVRIQFERSSEKISSIKFSEELESDSD